MNYKMSHKLFWISAIAGGLLMIVQLVTSIELIAWVAFTLLLFCIIQVSLFYRCPHCGGGLHISWNVAERCARCRRRLN